MIHTPRVRAEGPTELLGQPLSIRERQVTKLVIIGRTNKEIASELEVKTQTVKNHIRHIYVKTGATNRVELTRLSLAA